jgi:uncharacterized caspase-like protein
MKTSSLTSKLCVAVATLAAVCLFLSSSLSVKAQDIVGGAARTDLSGSAPTNSSSSKRPTARNATSTRTVTVTKTVKVTPTTGTVAVAAEPNAQLLIEPINVRGEEGQEGRVPAGERIFIFNELKPGRYRVAAELEGYTAAEEEVTVSANKSTAVSLDMRPIAYTVNFKFNVKDGEIRFAPVTKVTDPATTQPQYKPTDDARIIMIRDGRVVLKNLRVGTYGLDIRTEEIGYKTLLATITLPGPTEFEIKLDYDEQLAARQTRMLEQGDEQSSTKPLAPDQYYALVIGNDNYAKVRSLKMAQKDAKEVEAVLRQRYGFETKLLLDANRQQIMIALNEYRKKLDPNANLLIYYAGHGYRDAEADKAYWLPVDASKDDTSNWIIADEVTTSVKVMPARHVLIVSDSCYSGALSRDTEAGVSAPAARERYLRKMVAGKSRTLMASGGSEPVADGGGGGHSIFARAFLTGLDKMTKDEFTAAELFRSFIQESVSGRSDQTPEYSPLRNSGHDSGDFVFFRKK